MIIGTWITAVGEIVSLTAIGSGQFILGRAIVGIGMAGLFGMSIAMIPTVTKPEMLPKVYGKMFAMTAVGGLVAIIGSSVLSTIAGWRAGFSLNVICAVGVALFAMFAIPESKSAHQRKFDFAGVILAGAGLLLFMYGLGETGTKGLTDPMVLAAIIGGLALLVIFVFVELRIPHPSFPMAILKVPAVVGACIALVAAGLAQGAVQANGTELLQGPGGYSTALVGLLAVPLVIFGVIGALLTGRMVTKGKSIRGVFALTMGMLCLGTLACIFIEPVSALFLFPISLALIGFGMQGSFGVGATVIMRTAPPDMLGSVGTVKPVMGQLGYGLGLGAIVPVIAVFTNQAASSGLATKEAAFQGFNRGMIFVLVLELIAFVVAFFVLRAVQKGAQTPAGPDADSKIPGQGTDHSGLPPMDDSPERKAAVLEAEAQSEIP